MKRQALDERACGVDIRTGVVGYGYWGPNLVRNLMETEGADVVACVDMRSDRQALAKRRYPGIAVAARRP